MTKTTCDHSGIEWETADVKTCPHGCVYIDMCCDCLKDMLYRATNTKVTWTTGAFIAATIMDEDIQQWWLKHREYNNGASIPKDDESAG